MGPQQEIRKGVADLKMKVGQYSVSQKRRWRRVKELLRRFDNAGEPLRYHILNGVYVDLSSGKLVGRDGGPPRSLDLWRIVHSVDLLDAQSLVERLRLELKHPEWKRTSHGYVRK
jgi:hypothetical protein